MATIDNRYFKKHHKRLVAEGILKASLGGLMIGFAANFLAALAAWLFDFGGIWFAIGIGLGVGAVSGVLLYFLKLRPDQKDLARRVDRLGLEERMITMLEYSGDQSYIANLQRENAEVHLQRTEHKKIRLRVPKVAIVLTALALVLGSGMTTITGLAEQGKVPSGNEIINPEDPLAEYLAVSYIADDGGEIEGETDQLLLPGENGTPVVAVAEDGWMFIGWDDGSEDPERQELGVEKAMIFIALFEEVGDGDGEADEEGESGQGNGQEGDKAEDLPEGGEANVESGDPSQNGDKGSGSNSDSGESEGAGEGEEEGEGKGDGQGLGAGGKWEDSNQFIDGNTYYRDHLDVYYQLAQQIFEENGEIPPELREFFETYFNGI